MALSCLHRRLRPPSSSWKKCLLLAPLSSSHLHIPIYHQGSRRPQSTNKLPSPRLLRVALVGLPNVGKSTLFNRLTSTNARSPGARAIVTPIAGTTRDLKDGKCSLGPVEMLVTDTGGLEEVPRRANGPMGVQVHSEIQRLINEKVEAAVKAADVVLFILDARAGFSADDMHFGRWLLKMGCKEKTVVVANKAEGAILSDDMQQLVLDSYSLGMGEAVPISAGHNEGIGDLILAIHKVAEKRGFKLDDDEAKGAGGDGGEERITVSFIGLPNVGKSSLVNETFGETRLITSDLAGTTRDAVALDFEWGGRKMRLIDTAGIRRKGKRDHSTDLENLSVDEAMRAIRFSHVVVMVLDGQELQLRRMEQSLASLVYNEGRCLVVAANKADLLACSPSFYAKGVRAQLEVLLPQFGNVPVVTTSALTKEGVKNVLPAVVKSYDRWNHRVSTGLLNRWLEAIQRVHAPPPGPRNRTVKLKYMTQIKTRPPTFALVANVPDLDDSYVRFLKKKLQEEFNLVGMDVRINLRATAERNPYKPKDKTVGERRGGASGSGAGRKRFKEEKGPRRGGSGRRMAEIRTRARQ